MTFGKIIRTGAAFYATVGAWLLLIGTLLRAWTQHGFYVTDATPTPPNAQDDWFFVWVLTWLFSVAITCQGAFNREVAP